MIGALLVNLGTPASPSVAQVRSYLREFLMDPQVIDIPAPFRWLLVHGLILPFRPAKSAEAYRKVWTARGSPLLFHTLDLAEKVRLRLGDAYRVEPAMRYGAPSIESALQRLKEKGADKIVALPLYPQYSRAATASSVNEIQRVARKLNLSQNQNPKVLPQFHADAGFISASAQVVRQHLASKPADYVLFSFHGLPERQIRKTDPTGEFCLSNDDCCAEMKSGNTLCYRAQSFATARAIASELGLEKSRWSVSFQSRLGRTPWIRPYTDHVFDELAGKGIRRLAVACPSFVADCLETLEEVEIRGKEQFLRAGGENLDLIPCLNSSDAWVEVVARLIRAASA